MFHLLHRRDQKQGKIAKVQFEGEAYAAGVSFFRGDLPPGKGPGPHRHPYAETCIGLSGQVSMIVEGQEVVADAEGLVVIGPATPHRLTAVGDSPAEMVCIHASDRFIIEWLEG